MARFFVLILSALLSTTGCGPKKGATAATESAPSSSDDVAGLSKFQKKLVDTEITNWEPASNSGAQFIYNTLSFESNGTWKASGVVKADFEEFPCTESGTWTVTEEESANTATVEWSLKSTDCIMREVGISLRAYMDLSGGSYKFSFR